METTIYITATPSEMESLFNKQDYEKLAKDYLSIGYYWCDGYVFASY